jgi:hypothetical protein
MLREMPFKRTKPYPEDSRIPLLYEWNKNIEKVANERA